VRMWIEPGELAVRARFRHLVEVVREGLREFERHGLAEDRPEAGEPPASGAAGALRLGRAGALLLDLIADLGGTGAECLREVDVREEALEARVLELGAWSEQLADAPRDVADRARRWLRLRAGQQVARDERDREPPHAAST